MSYQLRVCAFFVQFGKISVPEDVGKVKKGGKNLVNLLKKAEEKEKRLNELRQANGDVSGASVCSFSTLGVGVGFLFVKSKGLCVFSLTKTVLAMESFYVGCA